MADDLGFDTCVNFVIDALEGGDALVVDPGGKTRFGISTKSHPTISIEELTRQEAVDIYYEQYWKPAGCDLLSWPFNLVTFDTAVNQGVSQAVQLRLASQTWSQMILGRIDRYAHLADTKPDLAKYFRGWVNRCITLYKRAKV